MSQASKQLHQLGAYDDRAPALGGLGLVIGAQLTLLVDANRSHGGLQVSPSESGRFARPGTDLELKADEGVIERLAFGEIIHDLDLLLSVYWLGPIVAHLRPT